ncbi:5-hydroxytryptamine receptor 2B-like [Clytia hemisphaerica]|uniref:G-protein coupled receptors family 1 profile domain-containing protein n=1 Tax=Clytia hemisphaerica TaxID=252671 RepID=A0A7M5UTN3_9CNID|eukprot:TCONS_00057264-protein
MNISINNNTIDNLNRIGMAILDRNILTTVYVLNVILGVPANSLLLYSLLIKKRESRRENINGYQFYAFMAIVDLINSSLVPSFHITGVHFKTITYDDYYENLCRVILSCNYSLSMLSLWALSLLSIDRCLALVYPFKYHDNDYTKTKFAVIAIVVCHTMIVIIPASTENYFQYEGQPGLMCGMVFKRLNSVYGVYVGTTQLALPSCIIGVSNCIVFRIAIKKLQETRLFKQRIGRLSVKRGKIIEQDAESSKEKPSTQCWDKQWPDSQNPSILSIKASIEEIKPAILPIHNFSLDAKNINEKSQEQVPNDRKKLKIIISTLFLFLNALVCWLPYLLPRFLAFLHIKQFSSRTFVYTVIGTTYISTLNPYIIFYTRKDLRLFKSESFVTNFNRQRSIKHKTTDAKNC